MKIKKKVLILDHKEKINSCIKKIKDSYENNSCPGIAVVLDKDKKLLGVVTEGDIRRNLNSKISMNNSITLIMNKNPIVIKSEDEGEFITKTRLLVHQSRNLSSDKVKHIVISDVNNKFLNIVNYDELLESDKLNKKRVCIFGLGYVGLTVSAILVDRGHYVDGIDTNIKLINNLNKSINHIHEPLLSNILAINKNNKKIKFSNKLIEANYDIYLICVGTPFVNGKPNLTSIKKILKLITPKLKKFDHIMLRSTLPVGSTRNFILKELNRLTNLRAGKDYYLSYCPERTVQGDALSEIIKIPQIISGYTSKCVEDAFKFWKDISSNCINAGSFESAELIKLANNSYRDLTFAFSNDLALKAEEYNIDAHELIEKANSGYSRSNIPYPSPGVGGYCLTKDPLIYGFKYKKNHKVTKDKITLNEIGRKINSAIPDQIIRYIKKYTKKNNLKYESTSVLILGLAFKGVPETNDHRNSPSVYVINQLKKYRFEIKIWDAVIKKDHEFKKYLIKDKNLIKTAKNSKIICILNNHPSNYNIINYENLNKDKLLIDAWIQLNFNFKHNSNFATLGHLNLV